MSVSPNKIACLGPEGSFSHEFALAHFSEDCPIEFFEGEFTAVLSAVAEGKCSRAVIPFLNTNGLDVRPAQIALGENRDWIRIEGCFPHLVTHNLIVAPHFVELKKVISKEQVFSQCSEWLKRRQEIVCEIASSTSAALRDLLESSTEEQQNSGAICNTLAHELYGGRILEERIQDPKNITFFLVVSKATVPMNEEQILTCLTCPTEECYTQTISEFAAANFPLKFSSLRGDFSEKMLCFLQFENSGTREDLEALLNHRYRHLIGAYPTKNSLSACISEIFDEDY